MATKKKTTTAKKKTVVAKKKVAVAKKVTAAKKKAATPAKAKTAKKVTAAKKATVAKPKAVKKVTAKKASTPVKKKVATTKASTVKKTSVAKKVVAKKKVATPAKAAPVKTAPAKAVTKVQLKGAAVKKVESKPFNFDAANEKRIKNILKRYPREQAQSALIPVLKLAQDQNNNWLSKECIQATAERLDIPFMRALEVATFYTMFNLDPVGKYHVQVCTNCSCMIRGSGKIVEAVKEFTGITENGETSEDEMFTITEVECLGACVDAPMMQVNNHYYTKLDKEQTIEILDALSKGEEVVNATPTKPLPEMY